MRKLKDLSKDELEMKHREEEEERVKRIKADWEDVKAELAYKGHEWRKCAWCDLDR